MSQTVICGHSCGIWKQIKLDFTFCIKTQKNALEVTQNTIQSDYKKKQVNMQHQFHFFPTKITADEFLNLCLLMLLYCPRAVSCGRCSLCSWPSHQARRSSLPSGCCLQMKRPCDLIDLEMHMDASMHETIVALCHREKPGLWMQ